MQNQDKQKITVIFVGPPSCGKSCLVQGYTPDYKTTIGVDFAKKSYIIDEKQVQFLLWDISASMTFNDKNLDQCKRGQVVACVYAVNDRNSFLECQTMAERLLVENKMRFDAKVILIGTKNDLPRQVSEQQGYQGAQVLKGSNKSGIETYFDVSSKTDPKAIQRICRSIYQVHKDPTIKTVLEIQQTYKPQQPAPSEIVQKPISLQPSKAHVVEPEFHRLYKLLLIGNDQTGKSAIVSQFARDQINLEYAPTIGVDFAIKVVDVQGERIKLQIWDTAGMKKFQTITTAYIKGCNAFFIVFDCTNRQSFLDIPQHVENITKFSFSSEKVCKFIVANKIDLERVVSREEGQEIAKKYGYQYIQVSALQKINLDSMFLLTADWLVKRQSVKSQ